MIFNVFSLRLTGAVAAALGGFFMASLLPTTANAQATIKPDGQWRYHFGVGSSITSGNSDASSLSLTFDSVRARPTGQFNVSARALLSRSKGESTGEVLAAKIKNTRELSHSLYAYGQGEIFHDESANISTRYSLAGGAGYHWIKTEKNTWDLLTGVGYTRDQFIESAQVAGALRDDYERFEWLLGQESRHLLTSSTTLKQRLVLYPNLSESGEFRADFDIGLEVAMSPRYSLNTALIYQYNSDPGIDLKSADLSLTTNITIKLD